MYIQCVHVDIHYHVYCFPVFSLSKNICGYVWSALLAALCLTLSVQLTGKEVCRLMGGWYGGSGSEE